MIQGIKHQIVNSKEESPATFRLFVVEATLYRDTELIGDMDPYLIITDSYGVSSKTRVLEDAGKHAVWNEELSLRV